jgi:DNA repair protein RadA/Sms
MKLPLLLRDTLLKMDRWQGQNCLNIWLTLSCICKVKIVGRRVFCVLKKNRFGTINEIGFFEMEEQGLISVLDINQQLLAQTSQSFWSRFWFCTIEGNASLFLLELQALTVESKFGLPQRVVSGIDGKVGRLSGSDFGKNIYIFLLVVKTYFFKVSGGFKIKDSGCDLGIALAFTFKLFSKNHFLLAH